MFEFPWLVFFPLSVFMVIKTAVVDLRSALTGFAVWRMQKEEALLSGAGLVELLPGEAKRREMETTQITGTLQEHMLE